VRVLWTITVIAVPLLLAGRARAICPSPATDQIIKLPGHPFAAEPSTDNCQIYVSIADWHDGGAVTVLANENGTFRIMRTSKITRRAVGGLALSHNGAFLAVAAEDAIVLMEVAKLNKQDQDPIIALLPDVDRGPIYAQFSKEDTLLFVSEERNRSIAVIDVLAAVQGLGSKAVVGRIPVGEAPVGLALSPDGTQLFSTSEIVGTSSVCRPEKNGGQMHAKGALFSIKVEKAATDPRHAVTWVMPAGCNPVRVVVSMDGRSLWVSERGDGHVMGLDPSILTSGVGSGQTTVISVGHSPIGLAIRPDGKQLWVSNSSRFSSAGGSLTVLMPANPAEAKISATLKVGAFPRDLRFMPDGKTLVVAMFGEESIMLHPTNSQPR